MFQEHNNMKRKEFKTKVSTFLRKMMDSWFEDKPFIKGLGLSLIDANINKFDSMIELFENENGDIDVKGIIDNMGDIDEPIKIDLKQLSPLLPNRIILISKNDLEELYK